MKVSPVRNVTNATNMLMTSNGAGRTCGAVSSAVLRTSPSAALLKASEGRWLLSAVTNLWANTVTSLFPLHSSHSQVTSSPHAVPSVCSTSATSVFLPHSISSPHPPPTSKVLFIPNHVLSYIKICLRNTNKKHVALIMVNIVQQKSTRLVIRKTSILALPLRSYVTRGRHLISKRVKFLMGKMRWGKA